MEDASSFALLVVLGVFAGGLGVLIGAGGGFVLAPALLAMYPNEPAETITTISLAVVFLNALSATLAYARTGKTRFTLAMLFVGVTIPGAVAGALVTTVVSRERFNLIFGLVLMTLGFVLAIPRWQKTNVTLPVDHAHTTALKFSSWRLIVSGMMSMAFGFISSFLGIGGGFLYMPLFVHFFNLPIHAATATSLFVLTITSFAGSATHMATGLFQSAIKPVIPLGIGAILGAQVAARLSPRIRGTWIMRGLALALVIAGLRLILRSL